MADMGDQKQLLNNAADVHSSPDPPPPYSPTQVTATAPPYSSHPVQGETQKFGVMPAAYPGTAQPPHPSVMLPPAPPTFVQPILQIQVPAPQPTILGPTSARIICPHCRADINTRVDKNATVTAYVSFIMLILFGCVCGCCLIPFCMDSCRSCEHYCPNCKRSIGRYS